MRQETFPAILALLIALLFPAGHALAGQEEPAGRELSHRLRGYLRATPGIRFERCLSDPGLDFLLHNRLNYRLEVDDDLAFRLEGRNRLVYREDFREMPEAKGFLSADEGLFDLTTVWLTGNAWAVQSMIDRLHFDWSVEDWHLRVGRQRINWGINHVSNPNDLFNLYSFFDFDYPERPGSDAIRLQYFPDHLSSVELAASAAGESGKNVFALKYLVNRLGFDIQAIAGRYHGRNAVGGGWAGNIGEAAFRGEATWFDGRDRSTGQRSGNLVAGAGIDYMFPDGTLVMVEALYNGGHGRKEEPETALVTEPLRADDIMFSRYALTVSAERAFSPVLSGGITLMSLPDINAFYLNPRMSRSLTGAIDLELAGQVYIGGKETPLENAGTFIYSSLAWSF